MTLRVLTAVGHEWEADLVTRIEAARELNVARRCADLADLLAAGAAGLGDLALVSVDVRGLDRDAIRHLATHRVRTVGVIRPGDDEAERRLRQLGIVTVVDGGLSAEDLQHELHSARQRPLDPDDGPAGATGAGVTGDGAPSVPVDEVPPHPDGRVVAVWGPAGAPGRTTIAVNLAAELAVAGRRALLVDLDTYGASVAQALALLDEAPGVASASRASELGTLDLPGLARLAPEVSPRLRVLTGIPSARRWPELRPGAVEHVLRLGRALADTVVVDCGFSIEDDEELSYDTQAPRRNAATLTTLAEADDLLVIGAGDPVGLQRLVRALQDLGTVPSPRPRVVVNQVRPGSVGAHPEARIAAALERYAGIDQPAFVPYDREALDSALLHGRTLLEHAPGSRVRTGIAELARAHLPETEGTRAARRGRRRSRPASLAGSRSGTM